MKILMTTMKMNIGGAETHILEAAKALTDQGLSITIASAGGVFEKDLAAAGIRHIYAPLHTKQPTAVLRAFWILDRLLTREHFDIVHAHARIPAVICAALCKKHHVRFVTTAHLTFKVNFLWRHCMSWGARSVAVSDDIKQYLIDEYGYSADNVAVTINGINTQTFSPDTDCAALLDELQLSRDKRRIVLVSRLDTDRSEAAVQLADVAPRLYQKEKNLEILIIGGGDDEERVRIHAEQANAAVGFPLVKLTGARTDINCCIAAGEIFVGVSRAVLEAMAMAKPVVVAGNEGYLGIFTKDKLKTAYDTNFCCRGCPMTSRESLYRDLETLLAMSAAERQFLGNEGRAAVEKHYSIARMARDYLDMYEAVRPYAPFRWGEYLICGYYGFGNMGDDSLLRAIIANLRQVSPDAKITVMSKTPKKTAAIYGTKTIQRFHPLSVIRAMRHAKVLLFGGGNLLQDGSSARSLLYYTWILKLGRMCGLKQMVYANGIGPLQTEKSRAASARALACADLVTLREKDSIEECLRLGVSEKQLRLTADPAFTLQEADSAWVTRRCERLGMCPGTRYFVVALREWKKDAAEKKAKVAAVCDKIYQLYGYVPVFLPMHDPLDVAVNREVADLCQCRHLFLTKVTGSELLGILRKMEFVIAMRLHTLIYSTAVGVPSMGLAYDGKLRAFMETMGQPYILETPEEKPFLACVETLIKEKENIRASLLAQKAHLTELAMQDAQQAAELLHMYE